MTTLQILIADHDRKTRLGLPSFDGVPGVAEVLPADSSEVALQRANQFMLDVVFMDVHIPDLGGIEAAKAIQRRQPATRVILLTTDEQQSGMVDGIQAGVSGYLMKDADVDELAAAGRIILTDRAVIDPLLMPMFIEGTRRSGVPSGVLPEVEAQAWLNPRWRRLRELAGPQLRRIFDEELARRKKWGGGGAAWLKVLAEVFADVDDPSSLRRITYEWTRRLSDEEFARLVDRTAGNP